MDMASIAPRLAAYALVLRILFCYPLPFAVVFARGDDISEYEIKAVFISKLAKFVDWPDGTFETPNTPVTICVLGHGATADLLPDVTKTGPQSGRPVAVRALDRAIDAKACQILYLAPSERRRLRTELQYFDHASVLTIGDAEGFGLQGCVIELWVEANRVRFGVNLQAAERSRLRLSSKLLSLATRILKD